MLILVPLFSNQKKKNELNAKIQINQIYIYKIVLGVQVNQNTLFTKERIDILEPQTYAESLDPGQYEKYELCTVILQYRDR